jgi:hypothetical protein
MKAYLLALITFLLTGCTTVVPVVAKFPEAPKELLTLCPKLKVADEKPELSELTKTIVTNYSEYHLCANRVEGWSEWYTQQKKLFEALK